MLCHYRHVESPGPQRQQACLREQALGMTQLACATGTPGSKQSEVVTPSAASLAAAVGAVRAWGCYVELLGPQFLQKDPLLDSPCLR